MLDQRLVKAMLKRGKAHFKYPNGRKMVVDLKKFYQCFAIFVRVQALQEKPKESHQEHDPQRTALTKAKKYFAENYEEGPPGINIIERVKHHAQITVEEKRLNRNLKATILKLGEWVTGDEKLFKFWGNSGWIRLCDGKPDHIGIWIY